VGACGIDVGFGEEGFYHASTNIVRRKAFDEKGVEERNTFAAYVPVDPYPRTSVYSSLLPFLLR